MCFIGTQNSINLSHGSGAAGEPEEDTKDTAQFEHVDSEQAAVAEQEQDTAEKALQCDGHSSRVLSSKTHPDGDVYLKETIRPS